MVIAAAGPLVNVAIVAVLTPLLVVWGQPLTFGPTFLSPEPGATLSVGEALRWLVGVETVAGHLSSTPVGGWASDETRPGFDQQPIEAWTLADAAVRAAEITGDLSWGGAVRLCASWFAGVNDTSTVMWYPSTGRSFDGLHCDGVNRNQGAESALALLSTAVDLGRMRRLVRWPGQAARS